MRKLRFAVFGCGFWSQYQIPAWLELDKVELVAVCDQDLAKAKATASKFKVQSYYDSPEQLLAKEHLDFIDIITDVHTHVPLVRLAAAYQLAVICQKPMAPDFERARQLVKECEVKGVHFFVHENFRWQAPVRRLKAILDSGVIGKVFKARITFCSAFPVFDNQPFLKDLDQFIITDVGSHILDVARFLLGEAGSLYCRIKSINPGIKGEDVASLLLEMKNGAHCFIEMSYASVLEREVFPQTLVLLEGEKGSVQLAPDFTIKVTSREGTTREQVLPKSFSWANPDYAVLHSSMVDIHGNLVDAIMNNGHAETTGADNLKTLQLVYAAYESAGTNSVIKV